MLPDEPAEASPEARQALAAARDIRAGTEATLGLAEQLQRSVRTVLAENQFASLIRRALERAAR